MGWQGGKPALLIHVAVQKTRDYFRNIICIVTIQAGNKNRALGSPDPAGRTVRTQNKASEKKKPFFIQLAFLTRSPVYKSQQAILTLIQARSKF